MAVTHRHACWTSRSARKSRCGLQPAPPLAEALVLALCVSAAGPLALLMLRFGAELVPVGLAVLVNQSDLRWEGPGGHRRLQVQVRLVSFGLFVLFVPSGESQDDVSIQDAQRHTSHGVFEVVLGGEAVVESCVWLVERLQQDPVVGLQDTSSAAELQGKKNKCDGYTQRSPEQTRIKALNVIKRSTVPPVSSFRPPGRATWRRPEGTGADTPGTCCCPPRRTASSLSGVSPLHANTESRWCRCAEQSAFATRGSRRTFGVEASALPQRVAVSDVLPPAPPATNTTATEHTSPQAPATGGSSGRPLTAWWKEWRPSSSPRPRRSRGPGPGSSRSRLCRKRCSGAATPESAPRLTTRRAVAVGTHTKWTSQGDSRQKRAKRVKVLTRLEDIFMVLTAALDWEWIDSTMINWWFLYFFSVKCWTVVPKMCFSAVF